MLLREEWDKLLQNEEKIYIYGAGKYGKKLFRILKQDGKENYVCGILVSDKIGNPERLGDKPVIQINELKKKNDLILIAVSDQYQDEIIRELKKMQFTKFVNAYKYIFLEYEDEKTLDVVDVWEIFQKQYVDGRFCRLDVIVKFLAIEEYFGENDFGMSLYRKMQSARIRPAYADIAEERFGGLIKSWEEKGYDADSHIVVNRDYRIIDGSHRMALALYFGLSYIKTRIIDEDAITNFGIDWFLSCVGNDEFKRIDDKYNLILRSKNSSKKSRVDKLKEEIYLILGENQDFGRGQFYQSLDEIGIRGQRPTEKRIELYGLRNLVKGKSVFDIGCNCGFMDISLGIDAKSVRGIEYNSVLVKIANRVRSFLGRENVCFEVGDFKEYIINKPYDVVFSFAVHQWIGLPAEKYCKKIVSMLKQGGYLVFESQDINKDKVFEEYCLKFQEQGLKKVKEERIIDDGKIERKFVIFNYAVEE